MAKGKPAPKKLSLSEKLKQRKSRLDDEIDKQSRGGKSKKDDKKKKKP